MAARGARVTLCGEREEFQLFRVHFVIPSSWAHGPYMLHLLHPRLTFLHDVYDVCVSWQQSLG